MFVRVKTELSDNVSGPSWKGLPLNEYGVVDKKAEVDPASYSIDQVVPLEPNGSQYDRRLWAEFAGDSGPGNNTGYTFNVYGAFEPENCLTANSVRFLSDERDAVLNALSSVGSESPRGYTLLPAGLLWSWRMLLPEWRDGNGWATPASLNTEPNKQRAIVLFATGNNDNWPIVNDMPSPPIHKSDFLWERDAAANNQFAFQLDYMAKDCKNKNNCKPSGEVTHIQAPYIPDVKPGNLPKKEDPYWQFPSTALLLADPFANEVNPDTAGWPSMNNYTSAVCNAIKNDGIYIYVVDVNDSGSQVLANCSSDGILYSLDRVPELRNVLQVTQTSGDKLRLIR